MASEADSLRSTLDNLVVDPAAKADRPYLESMLRRLGYSEVEIQTYLGTAPALASAAVAAPDTGERVIELEYTGPGLREYRVVLPPDETSFAVDADGNPVDLAGGLTAGEEVLSGGPSMSEVDALMEQQDLSDFGDYTAGESEVGKMNVVEGEEDLTQLGTEAPAEGDAGDMVEFGESAPADVVEFSGPPEVQVGEELVEFVANPVNVGYTTPNLSEPTEGAEGDAGASDLAEEGPFTYQDWTLYSREVDLSDGRSQRVYFFSKGEPSDGQPAPMPGGYEVGVNDQTGLPYLRRASEGADPADIPQAYHSDAAPTADAGRKRVRVKRIRAATRDEAERQVREEGGEVLTSVPVDIQERWDE